MATRWYRQTAVNVSQNRVRALGKPEKEKQKTSRERELNPGYEIRKPMCYRLGYRSRSARDEHADAALIPSCQNRKSQI